MMLEVEGETPEAFMKLMRHEAAHAYSYAYQLQRKEKVAADFRTNVTPKKLRRSIGLDHSVGVMSCISTIGTRRRTRTKTSPRPSRLANTGVRLAQTLRGLESAPKTRIHRRTHAVSGRKTTGPCADVSRCRLRLSERKAEDVLRSETETLRRYLSRISTMPICDNFSRRQRDQSQLLSAPAAAAVNEFGVPMDE